MSNTEKYTDEIRHFKSSVKKFKEMFDTLAGQNTNAFNTPEYQGFNNVHPTRGETDSDHWKTSNKSNSEITEDHHTDPNDEFNMVLSQLENMISDAEDILDMIEENQQFDAWVQNKLTKAADYLNTVKKYLRGEEAIEYRKMDDANESVKTYDEFIAETLTLDLSKIKHILPPNLETKTNRVDINNSTKIKEELIELLNKFYQKHNINRIIRNK